VQGVPGDPIPEIRDQNGTDAITITPSNMRNYITFQRLKINGINTTSGDNQCVAVVGGNITFDNVEIYNCWFAGLSSFSVATSLTTCQANHHLTIRNSHIHNTGERGRGSGYGYYGYAQDLLFENNEVDHVAVEFMQIYYSAAGGHGCNPARAVVRNNYFHDLRVGVAPSSNAGRCGQGIVLNGSDAQIYNNRFVLGCTNTTATSFLEVIGAGVGPCITNPEVSNGRVFVWNNVFVGASPGTGDGVRLNSCVVQAGSEIKNNVILQYSGSATSGSQLGTASVTTNRTSGFVTDCFNSLTDYRLRPGTNPCRDTGTSVAAVTTDFQGSRRPQGGAYDIGPCEQQSGTLLAAPTNLKVQ
jgi:hypothetical protein